MPSEQNKTNLIGQKLKCKLVCAGNVYKLIKIALDFYILSLQNMHASLSLKYIDSGINLSHLHL